MEWKDILKLATDSPDKWIEAIDVAVNAAKADGNLGALEIFKYLPTLDREGISGKDVRRNEGKTRKTA